MLKGASMLGLLYSNDLRCLHLHHPLSLLLQIRHTCVLPVHAKAEMVKGVQTRVSWKPVQAPRQAKVQYPARKSDERATPFNSFNQILTASGPSNKAFLQCIDKCCRIVLASTKAFK